MSFQEKQHLLFTSLKFKESLIRKHPNDEDVFEFQVSFEFPINFRYGEANMDTHEYSAFVDLNPRVFFNCLKLGKMSTGQATLNSFEDFLSQKFQMTARQLENSKYSGNNSMQFTRVSVPVGHAEYSQLALVSTATMALCGVLTFSYISFFLKGQ